MKLNKIISYKVYPFDLLLSFNESDKQFQKNLKKLGVTCTDSILEFDNLSSNKGRTFMLPTGQSILRLNFYPKTSVEFGILQHEIFHCVEFVLDRIGMKLNSKSDEAYAYLIQYLTTKIYKLIK